jgi:hypothetical protein
VEFKTDHVRDDAALAKLLSARDEGAGYLGQVRRYASAFEHFLGERPSVRLCLLDFEGRTRVLDEHGGDFAVAPDDPRDGAG